MNNVAESVLTPAYSGSGCGTGTLCGAENSPLVAGGAGGFVDTNNSYIGNVLVGGLGVQLFNNDATYFSCSNNQCSADPLLVSASAGNIGSTSLTWIPGNDNFALQSTSPAIGWPNGAVPAGNIGRFWCVRPHAYLLPRRGPKLLTTSVVLKTAVDCWSSRHTRPAT